MKIWASATFWIRFVNFTNTTRKGSRSCSWPKFWIRHLMRRKFTLFDFLNQQNGSLNVILYIGYRHMASNLGTRSLSWTFRTRTVMWRISTTCRSSISVAFWVSVSCQVRSNLGSTPRWLTKNHLKNPKAESASHHLSELKNNTPATRSKEASSSTRVFETQLDHQTLQ